MAKNKIPKHFESIEEIQEFWDNNSTADFWDEMVDVDMELSPALKAKLEKNRLYRLLGLSPEQVRKIEDKARVENTNSKDLISKWVVEHV